LIPLPPGIEYPWRTELGRPDPYETAAFRRARLVVENAQVGADYYADHWQPLPPVGRAAAVHSRVPDPGELIVAEPPQRRRSESSRAVEGEGTTAPAAGDSAGNRVEERMGEGTSEPAPVDVSGDRRIDINTASVEELETLSGIGPSLATRIIEARPYRRVQDLLDVHGIGPRTLDRFEGQITVR
jgi:competence protein ComEA